MMNERLDQIQNLVPLVNSVTSAFKNSSEWNTRLKHARDIRRLAFMLASELKDVTMHEATLHANDKLFAELSQGSDELVVALLNKIRENKKGIATVCELSQNFAVHRKAAEFEVMAPQNVSES